MKELTITNQELLELDTALEQAGAVKANPDFSMKVAYNRQILKPHVKAMSVAKEMSASRREYEDGRLTLVKEYGVTSPDGKSLNVPPEKNAEFQAKLKPLLETYQSAIDEYEEQIKTYRDNILPSLANEGKPISMHQFSKNLPSGLDGNLVFALIELMPEFAG